MVLKNPIEQYSFSGIQRTVKTPYMCKRIHDNKCECTTIINLTVNNRITFGAMPSLADSEGILGTEGFKSSANLSALMNGTRGKVGEFQISVPLREFLIESFT